MARFAFICPPFLGHLHPMLALARGLAARGHEAVFLHMADAGPLVRRHGVAFEAVGEATHPAGTLAAVAQRLGRVEGAFGLGGVIRDMAASTDMFCRTLPEALRSLEIDCLVVDQAEAAGGLVAASMDLPFVSVANALPLNREPAVPPPFTGWRYDPGAWGVERNAGGHRVADRLMRSHGAVIARWAAAWRLGPRRTVADCLSPLAEIHQIVPALDFPRRALPAIVHSCGRLRDGSLVPAGIDLPSPDGRPVLYGSLGTLQGGRKRLVRTMAAAAHRCGATLILAHGGRLSPADVAALPGHPVVHDFVPQDAVLARADLAILNGGLNTVLDALAAGVPPLVVPIAFEQAAIAARVVRSRAGESVSRRFLTAGRLARRIERMLANPARRAAASEVARALEDAGGVGRAVAVIEAVAATGRPVLRGGGAAPVGLAA